MNDKELSRHKNGIIEETIARFNGSRHIKEYAQNSRWYLLLDIVRERKLDLTLNQLEEMEKRINVTIKAKDSIYGSY